MGFWGNLLNGQKRYDRDKKIAVTGSVTDRLKLARSARTNPEILYYLAQQDLDPGVREAVARNKATPIHASSVLASDQNQDVRLALANRLTKLLPHLSPDRQSQLYQYAIQSLGTLALDEVLKIRIALSSALKDQAKAPPKIVGQLARDIEREVSEPVLKFCIALSDEDLLEILKGHPSGWAVQAIAGRKSVSEPVSQAVIDTDDVEAGLILLENRGAKISTQTMTNIVEKSKTVAQWQKPIAIRKNLPPELAKELSHFVDESVRLILSERTDYDAHVMDEISEVVRRRLDMMDEAEAGGVSAEDRVRQMIRAKTLNEDAIADALGVKDKELATVALAALVRTSRSTMEKIMALQAPKPVVAVCWKAGLSMRMCLRIQQELALIPAKEQLLPRGGTDYPMEEAEINWQLEFFGLK